MENDEKGIFSKSKGQILFKIEKLSEFAQAPAETRLLSDLVFVRGLFWRIWVYNRENKGARHLSCYLYCNANNSDTGWSCAATAKLKILAQKEGKEDFVRPIMHVYNAKDNNKQYGADHTFPNANPNATITVDKEAVEVNSYLLALSSDYFDRNFFDNRYPPSENIELPESTTVKDFKRLIDTLPPKHVQLDDDCIEAVLILADRFSMDNVISLCRSFLLYSSNKPKLFKFRLAHKYGWKEMEEAILRSMQPDDLVNLEKFLENAEEYAMLDDEAKAALATRNAELVSGRKK